MNFDTRATYRDTKAYFYLRYPKATLLLDAEYVLEKLASWPYPALLEQVRSSLPLSESTDLYKYALNSDDRYALTERMDRLAADAVIETRAKVLAPLGCCLRAVRVTRTSLGVEILSIHPHVELLRTNWIPEQRGSP